MYFCFICDRKV